MTSLLPLIDRIKASRERAIKQATFPARARSFRRRKYQEEDIEWLREQKRGILAHAPGLGKTFCSCEALETPAVIACPSNLVEQWADFIADQYPTWEVIVASRGDVIKRDAGLKRFAASTNKDRVLIVNHDMYSRFYMPNCETLVVDEFHHFRHRGTQRSKGMAEHAGRTPRLYGLTATPVYKDVGDLWHQLHLLDPLKWRYYNPFIEAFAYTTNHGFGQKILKVRNEPELKRQIKPYMRERTYKEVGMFLPDRIDKQIELVLDPKWKKNVYDKLRDFYRLEIEGEETQRFMNAGAVLHQLRKILVTEEKLDAVKSIVDDTPGDEPILVFCWYKDTAAQVAEAIDGICITGDEVNPAKRRELALTGGPDKKRCRVATMASLSEGVEGLDISHTVIFCEEDYVPGRNYQALTRVQRARSAQAQDRDPVVCYWVRYKGTVDMVVHETAKSRTSGNAMSVLKEALALE